MTQHNRFGGGKYTYLAFGAPDAVSGRHAYGTESVDGDTEDGVDGAQAGGVVQRQPQVAQNLAERPRLTRQDVDCVQRHGNRSCTMHIVYHSLCVLIYMYVCIMSLIKAPKPPFTFLNNSVKNKPM